MRHTGLYGAAHRLAAFSVAACLLVASSGFSAVAVSAPLEPPVRAAAILKARGVMVGYEDGTMRWENTLTRAEAIKIIVTGIGRGDEATSAAGGPSWFSDVTTSHWAIGYITVGVELGIVRGYPDGTFGPENPVTIAELCVMLSRMYVALGANPADPLPGVMVEPDWAAVEVLHWPGLVGALGLERATDAVPTLDYPASRAETATLVEDTMERAGLALDIHGTLLAYDAATGTVKVAVDQRNNPVTLRLASGAVWLQGNAVIQGPSLVNEAVGIVTGQDGKVLLIASMGS